MNFPRIILSLLLSGFLFISCEKEDEVLEDVDGTEQVNPDDVAGENENEDIEVEQFIYSAMNDIYLYKADIEQLADGYFNSETAKNDYLRDFETPEALFGSLVSRRDRFSFITDDYFALEDEFDGISSSTAGIEFGLGSITNSNNNIFAFVRYIVPESAAAEAGLTRGTVFTEIDGESLTLGNLSELLDQSSFTINIGRIENNRILITDETVTLTKKNYTENPVFIAKTLEVEGEKVGYLMYNSFIDDFDDELNAEFGKFKAEGINELVLDLRYNGGGSVESAVDLASMITGQFEGEIFMREQWNEDYQAFYESQLPEQLLNRFNTTIRTGEAINSLNLTSLYVISTGSTASASELIINGLEPYINVVQIGGTTTGKFQASATLYDGEGYNRENANENHTYALQPLILKSANVDGKSDYEEGLMPDFEILEDLNNFGVLGEPTEPLLEAALNHMFNKTQETKSMTNSMKAGIHFQFVGESGMDRPSYQKMYIDKLPDLRRNK